MAFQERTVVITGTAAIANLWYYKFEYRGAGEAEWHFIGDVKETSVISGTLFTWDTSVLLPGTYRLQLVVVDKTGNYPPPCDVDIEIVR